MNAYYQIFADLPVTDYESAVTWLEKELELSLTKAYEEKYEEADVRHFNDTKRRIYTFSLTAPRIGAMTHMAGRHGSYLFMDGHHKVFLNATIKGCSSF